MTSGYMVPQLFEIISYVFTTCFIADFLQFIAGIPWIKNKRIVILNLWIPWMVITQKIKLMAFHIYGRLNGFLVLAPIGVLHPARGSLTPHKNYVPIFFHASNRGSPGKVFIPWGFFFSCVCVGRWRGKIAHDYLNFIAESLASSFQRHRVK